MTLDDYQARVRAMTERMKDDFMAILQEGIASKLDEELMLAIFEREFNKVMGK